MWDVNSLKKIDEFEKLDYWTLVKIAEMVNRVDEVEKEVDRATEELREERDSYEEELDNAEYTIRDLESSLEKLSDLLKECYETRHRDVKSIIEHFDLTHPYQFEWDWLDKNK